MTISPLADLPDAIRTLAKWFYDEWHAIDGRSIECIEAQLAENLNRSSIPITFVAHRHSELLGSVSLDLSDLPPFSTLYLWTPDSTQLYERCGCTEFASATYGSQPIKLMRFSNEQSA